MVKRLLLILKLLNLGITVLMVTIRYILMTLLIFHLLQFFTITLIQFPVNFETGTTLLKPLCIEGHPEYVFDESDHLWYSNDLRQYGYCVGSKIKMMGHVTTYRRKDGSIDFSLQPDSVMIHR